MFNKIGQVIELLETKGENLTLKKGLVGFDGFIDEIVRPIKQKCTGGNISHFQTAVDFGEYIVNKSNKSFCIELDEQIEKMGGNAPIMANALGRMGIGIDCIAALGTPEINKVFCPMTFNNCTIHSFADPGHAISLEYDSGKLILAKMGDLNKVRWENVVSAVGLRKLIQLFEESDFLGIVNWSELLFSNDIWEGILKDVLPAVRITKQRFMFIDLADCSSRDIMSIHKVLELMGYFARYYKVVLGMNENEANQIYKTVCPNGKTDDIYKTGQVIFDSLRVNCVVIHPNFCSIAWSGHNIWEVRNCYVEKPMLSTGGGDNFNAGFCAGQLLGADVESSMILANAVSGCYIRNGLSPDINEILAFLRFWKSSIA